MGKPAPISLGLALLAVLLTVTLAPPASAAAACHGYQQMHVVNRTAIPRAQVLRAERAVAAQTRQVSAVWHTPCATFGARGWREYIVPALAPQAGRHFAGYHTDSGGVPYAVVGARGWTVTFSHETVEMLAAREICDPVGEAGYRLDGVRVADWVYPAWFGSRVGRLDETGGLQPDGTISLKSRPAGSFANGSG